MRDFRLVLGSVACASIIGESTGNIESKSPVRFPRNGTLASIRFTRASFDPSGLPNWRARFHRHRRYNSTVFARGEVIRSRDQNLDSLLILFPVLLSRQRMGTCAAKRRNFQIADQVMLLNFRSRDTF